jgi:hypothetical protein
MEKVMDVNGVADILLRNDDEFDKFTADLGNGRLSPEDGARTLAFFNSIAQEAREESRNHSDPKAAFRKIAEEKYAEAMKVLRQTLVQRLTASQCDSPPENPNSTV